MGTFWFLTPRLENGLALGHDLANPQLADSMDSKITKKRLLLIGFFSVN
jgi:hypothetical protein